jgi:hypothetical protein
MIRRPRTRTIPHTPNLPHTSRKRRDNLLRTGNSRALTRANLWDRRVRVPAEAKRTAAATLHLSGAGTLVRLRGARAVGHPATVAPGEGAGAALGFGAALDRRGVGFAVADVRGAAGAGAG